MPLIEVIGPAYVHALETHAPGLVAQLDADLPTRDAGGAGEPALAAPRPDGPLAGLEPVSAGS